LSHQTKNEIIKQQAVIQQNRDTLAIEAKLEQNLLKERPKIKSPDEIPPSIQQQYPLPNGSE